ncbi:hypothetical protein HMPREF3150_05172 [Pseudomonas aeruginosa]|nr:hypothetical protein HMPREF3150_05172 [Pseudomonas aeruginosa]
MTTTNSDRTTIEYKSCPSTLISWQRSRRRWTSGKSRAARGREN